MRNADSENVDETFLNDFREETGPRFIEIMISRASRSHTVAKETKSTHVERKKGLDILRPARNITTLERDELVYSRML